MMLILAIILALVGFFFFKCSMASETFDGLFLNGFASLCFFAWSLMSLANIF